MKTILIFYDYFYPAAHAGGIVTSLLNLVKNYDQQYRFYVFTSCYDLGEHYKMKGVEADRWVRLFPGTYICYSSEKQWKFQKIRKVIEEIAPDLLYVNGLFSLPFALYPLYLGFQQHIPVVMAPRGMLHPGALKVKPLKKKVFLALFIMLKMHKKVYKWHATHATEKVHIQKTFPGTNPVYTANDTPDLEDKPVTPVNKERQVLDLVTISLITEKKNIAEMLYLLKEQQEWLSQYTLRYHIYGPVKDQEYWKNCQAQIDAVSGIDIQYKGSLNPEMIPEVFGRYHCLVLPTRGENFGHVIYEALNAGRPVITTDKTPWNDLAEWQAGWNYPLHDTRQLLTCIQEALMMDQETFNAYCAGAKNRVRHFTDHADYMNQYKQLFATEL